MPKRFHDTDLKNKDWYIGLSAEEKAFFHWIAMDQSSAGIWDVNMTMPRRLIPLSESFNLDSFIQRCNSDGKQRMIKINDGKKLFFTPTIDFQFRKGGEDVTYLNPAVPARKGVLNQLNENEETSLWLQDRVMRGEVFIGKKEDKPQSKTDRSGLTPQAKEKIKTRDNHTCQYCGSQDKINLQVDHILPIVIGGNYNDNLITACATCNKEKGTKHVLKHIESTGLAPEDNLVKQIEKLMKRGAIGQEFQGLAKGIGIGIGIGNNRDTRKDSTSKKLKNSSPNFAQPEPEPNQSTPKPTPQKPKQASEPKKEYAVRVHLSETEHLSLINECGKDILDLAIQKLSAYKLSKNKRYASDAGALRSWAIGAVRKDLEKTDPDPGGGAYPDFYSPGFEKKLETEKGMQEVINYHIHLKKLGWTKVHAPGGTVWQKPKV